MIQYYYAHCNCRVTVENGTSLCTIEPCIKHGKQYHFTPDELRDYTRQCLSLFNAQANDEAIDKMMEEFV